jgi:hypothetical protein
MKRVFLVFLAVMSCGCAPTRHLDVTAQERMTKQISFGKFELDGIFGGKARGEIAGEKFQGTWSATVRGTSTTSNDYGQAYGYVGTVPVNGAYSGQTKSRTQSNNADVSLMMIGDKGTSLSCQFIAAVALWNQGQGVCQDNRGLSYDFHY